MEHRFLVGDPPRQNESLSAGRPGRLAQRTAEILAEARH
jgi:hypothetical protein